MRIFAYDFDGTIYDGDSTVDFYFYCLKHKKNIIKYIPKQFIYIVLYKIGVKSKKQMKEVFFSFLKSFPDINPIVDDFWKKHEAKLKVWYLQKNHDKDIIVSASPYFLLEKICKKLNVKGLIATNVDKKNGKFLSENCYGEEKVKMLYEKYDNVVVEEMYTDSLADKPMLKIAKRGFMINKNKISEWKF